MFLQIATHVSASQLPTWEFQDGVLAQMDRNEKRHVAGFPNPWGKRT